MYLTSEDAELLDGSITIISATYRKLREIPVEEALKDLSKFDERTQERYARKDRKDTKYWDIVAENAISLGDGFSGHLDLFHRILKKQGVIITEECGRVPRETMIEHDTPVIISDPIDISVYIEQIREKKNKSQYRSDKETLGQLFDKDLEETGLERLRRHASSSSVTLLRDNMIKYTIVMNLFTKDIYIGSPKGIFRGDISSATSAKDIKEEIEFLDDETLTTICYTKEGKYEQNRSGTHLRFFPLDPASWKGPVGPLRFTYLVKYGDGDKSGVGIVAHNGEKIQEILPNIAISLFSKGRLRAYKLFCDTEYAQERAGVGMTPNLANSLYSSGLIANTGVVLRFLNNYEYPSQFRDTTAIISSENDAALTMFEGMVKRGYATRIV